MADAVKIRSEIMIFNWIEYRNDKNSEPLFEMWMDNDVHFLISLDSYEDNYYWVLLSHKKSLGGRQTWFDTLRRAQAYAEQLYMEDHS